MLGVAHLRQFAGIGIQPFEAVHRAIGFRRVDINVVLLGLRVRHGQGCKSVGGGRGRTIVREQGIEDTACALSPSLTQTETGEQVEVHVNRGREIHHPRSWGVMRREMWEIGNKDLHDAVSSKYRAPNKITMYVPLYASMTDDHSLRCTDYSVRSTAYRVQSTEYRVQSTEYRVRDHFRTHPTALSDSQFDPSSPLR